MLYTGPERRQYPRAEYRFVVSYRVLEEKDNVDISQTKNLGLGGMWLTTNRKFGIGAKLALDIRLPFDPDPIKLIAVVVEAKEVVSNLIYDTHLAFLSIDEKHKKTIGKAVDHYLEKKEE
jgi:c-di-GMP-binding flagellar brake protein YcgR